MNIYKNFLLIVITLLLSFHTATAKVNIAKYGISVMPDSLQSKWSVSDSLVRLLENHPQLSGQKVIMAVESYHLTNDKTMDFYLILLICIFLGFIRFLDPRYAQNVWTAFFNPTLSSRQLREKLEGAPFPNLLMNIFFTVVAGAYLYYAVQIFTPQRSGNIPPSLLVLSLIAGVMLIYLAKYLMIRFSGWAFKVEGVTTHYIFNVFLINKILAVALLPFVVIMAFAAPSLREPAIIISLIIIGVLLVNRYSRSWQVFGSFFQYSKFHFFTYLCASELLPMAILMKLLVRGLL